jgi:hypothetical protein
MTRNHPNPSRTATTRWRAICLLGLSVLVVGTGLIAIGTTGAAGQEINVTDPTAEEPTPEIFDELGPITIRSVETTGDNTLRVEVEHTGDSPQRIGIVQVPSNRNTILWDSVRLLPGEESVLLFNLVSNPSKDRPVAYLNTGEARIPTVQLVPPSESEQIPLREGVFLGSAVALLAVGLAARRRVEETGEPEIDK